jgi:hypothetical protein
MITLLIIGCVTMLILIAFPNLVMKTSNINEDIPNEQKDEYEQVNVEGDYVEVKTGKISANLHSKFNETLLNNTMHVFDSFFTADYFGYYFKSDKMLVKDMDKNVISNLALQGFANKLQKNGTEGVELCVSKEEITNYSKTVLYKDVMFEDLNETILNEVGDFYYKDGKYCGKLLGGKDPVGYNIYHRIVGYNKGSLYLSIYSKFTFCQVVLNNVTKKPDCVFRKTVDDLSTENIIGRAEFSLSPSQEIFNKANTYKFNYLIKGDNLYFHSIEKVI